VSATSKMSRALIAALVLAVISGVLRAQFVFFPPGDHLDEKIIAALSKRAVDDGKFSANWLGLENEWSRPTYQFSPYTLLENAGAFTSNRLFKWPVLFEDQIRFARWFSAALGAIAVLCCCFTAIAWFGDVRTALLAELFLATAFLHVQDSCYARVEAMLSLSVMLAFWAAAAVMNRPTQMRRLVLGFAIGFAVAVKYNAAPLVLLSLAALARRHPGEPGASATGVSISDQQALGESRSELRSLTLPARFFTIVLAALVGFIVATPEVILHPSPLVEGLRYEIAHYSEGHIPHQAIDASDGNARFWWNYFTRLGFGWAPTLATIGFLFLALRRRGRDGLLALYLVAATALLLSSKVRFERNAEIMLGPACIAAARFWIACWTAIRPSQVSPFLRAALIIALLGNIGQHGLALWDFRQQQKRRSSPLQMIPEAVRLSKYLGQPINNEPPANWREYDVLILSGYSDAFSQRGLREWGERLKGEYDMVLIRSDWYRIGYPFSTVETYHGPGFILRAARKPRSSP
jgi:hypothetical protein